MQDPTLLTVLDPFSGLSDYGFVLINSAKRTAELGLTALQEQQPHPSPSHLPLRRQVDLVPAGIGPE